MPYSMFRLPDGHYRVINTESRRVHSKHSTKENAQKQMRLLNAVEHGFVPTGKPAEKK